MSGLEEQASEHHSKQAGRDWDVKVSLNWARVVLKAIFEKAGKSQVESAVVKVLERGRTEASVVLSTVSVRRSRVKDILVIR